MRRLHYGIVLLALGFIAASCGPSKSSSPEKTPEQRKPSKSVNANRGRDPKTPLTGTVEEAVQAFYEECKRENDDFLIEHNAFPEHVQGWLKIVVPPAICRHGKDGGSVRYEITKKEVNEHGAVHLNLTHTTAKGEKRTTGLDLLLSSSGWIVVSSEQEDDIEQP